MTKSPSADGAIISAAATPSQSLERNDPKPRRKRSSSPGSVFAYRGRWRAQVNLPSGHRVTKDFDDKEDAERWRVRTLAGAEDVMHLPELGGPTGCTLAEAMWHYAHIYTVNKGGADAELNRISHYLRAARLPILKLEKGPNGRRQLRQVDWRTSGALPSGFAAWQAERLDSRPGTYAAIAELANKRASQITTLMVRNLKETMKSEGLSDSTIQKEVALIKAIFNKAIKEWSWTGFLNPAVGIELGKSESRFVIFTKKDRENLDRALNRCDNPVFPLLVEAAIWIMARRDSLLRLHRSDVDLDARTAVLRKSKVGTVVVPLSHRAVEVLKRVPEHPSGLFFPMTASAVDNAWDGVRVRAGRTDLQFRDLRHVGGTAYARRGLSAHQLRLLLGHKTLHQALVYVNLVATDVLEALDRTEPDPSASPALPPVIHGSAQEEMRRRRAQRLNAQRPQNPEAGAEVDAQPDLVVDETPSADRTLKAPENGAPAEPVPEQAPSNAPSGHAGRNVILLFPTKRVVNG